MKTMTETTTTWRVECEERVTYDVTVTSRARVLGAWPHVAEHRGQAASGGTPRAAVLALASLRAWSVVSILAPGEATRAELVSRVRLGGA